MQTSAQSSSRTKLDVPWPQREKAKAAGARWDKEARAWFAPEGADLADFSPFIHKPEAPRAPASAAGRSNPIPTEGTPLEVPFAEKDQAKALGARWDPALEVWMAPPGADPKAFERWASRPLPAISEGAVVDAFMDYAAAAGLEINRLEADGKIHRVRLEGSPRGLDGAYALNMGERPCGFVQNFKTGFKEAWFPKMARLSPEQAAAARARAAIERAAREAAEKERQEQVSLECSADWERLDPAPGRLGPYAARKGLASLHGARLDGSTLVVPARDEEGRIWTLQRVGGAENALKLFAKGGRKRGCFHLIGDPEPGRPLLVAEGFATGASLREATGLAVAVAFDAGNLKPTCEALARMHPQARICVCADNDRWGPENRGVADAKEAAAAVGGAVAVPQFPPGPDGWKPTDFNDLASSGGLRAVRTQVREAYHERWPAQAPAEAERRPAPRPSRNEAPALSR